MRMPTQRTVTSWPKCRPSCPWPASGLALDSHGSGSGRLCNSRGPLPIRAIWAACTTSSSTRPLARPFWTRAPALMPTARAASCRKRPCRRPRTPRYTGLPHSKRTATEVDIRHLTDDASPAVVSYIIEEEYGWTTAINANKGLLIGYIWPEENTLGSTLGRHVRDGKPFARGLEFGTTGLHQPSPVLLEKGRFSAATSFTISTPTRPKFLPTPIFSWKFPSDFAGVADVEYSDGQLVVGEDGGQGRELTMEVGELFVW